MPIYAYKCESCGYTKDVLQKMSDTPLTVCPTCDAPAFKKQLTAAGFQLKGSGWYATDFKGTGAAAASATTPDAGEPSKSAETSKPAVVTPAKSDAAPAAASTASGGGTV